MRALGKCVVIKRVHTRPQPCSCAITYIVRLRLRNSRRRRRPPKARLSARRRLHQLNRMIRPLFVRACVRMLFVHSIHFNRAHLRAPHTRNPVCSCVCDPVLPLAVSRLRLLLLPHRPPHRSDYMNYAQSRSHTHTFPTTIYRSNDVRARTLLLRPAARNRDRTIMLPFAVRVACVFVCAHTRSHRPPSTSTAARRPLIKWVIIVFCVLWVRTKFQLSFDTKKRTLSSATPSSRDRHFSRVRACARSVSMSA